MASPTGLMMVSGLCEVGYLSVSEQVCSRNEGALVFVVVLSPKESHDKHMEWN